MAQFMMKQNTAHADAVMCAPAACSARMEAASASENLSMDTAMCAVSFFVVLVLAVVLRLIGSLLPDGSIGRHTHNRHTATACKYQTCKRQQQNGYGRQSTAHNYLTQCLSENSPSRNSGAI